MNEHHYDTAHCGEANR